MKSDLAAVGVINRVGAEMINIHQHCQKHHKLGVSPALSESPPGRCARDDEMQIQVDKRTNHDVLLLSQLCQKELAVIDLVGLRLESPA